MNEIKTLKKLFLDHFDGDPWIDISIMGTLKNVNAGEAIQNFGNLNSIWQIVNHMVSWRETLLKRIQNESAPSPDDNFFHPVENNSEEAWQQTLARLRTSQETLLAYLSGKTEIALDEHPGNGPYSRYELLEGILQHDVYHLGQLVLIKKLLSR